jgi:hypothetical protein
MQNTWTSISYQRKGTGQRPVKAYALMHQIAARVWLEEKLGPLVPLEEQRVAAVGQWQW